MKKIFLLAAFISIATLNAKAQTEEPESKVQKFFRLTKTADDNPKDWKSQLEAGHFLLDKENGMYNQSQAERYYDRIFHLATDYNKEIPDSVIHEAGVTLMTVASDKKNIDKALFYADEMLRTEKVGAEMANNYYYSYATVGWMYNMMKGDCVRALPYMMDIRDRMTKSQLKGVEHTDVTTAILFENMLETYKKMFGDKLVELIFDGKKYTLVAKGDWNIEKPFIGWMLGEGGSTLLCDEDGKIYDNIHGEMEYGFNFGQDGIVSKEGTNMWLITVTPERRQQLVEAYHKYMKKTKKNKK